VSLRLRIPGWSKPDKPAAPAVEPANQSFIYTRDNALPDALCDDLIERFEAHHGVHPGLTGAGVMPERKRSRDLTVDNFKDFRQVLQQLNDITFGHCADYFFQYPFFGSVNPVLKHNESGTEKMLTPDRLDEITPDIMKMIVKYHFEFGTTNIQQYQAGKGGYPHWHSEIFPETSGVALHRLLFYIYYLNDVTVGGETEFLIQKKKVQPKKGSIVIAPAGFTHTHRGNVPVSGDKYILTSWLLYKRATGGKGSR
jgi:hypothetical protein